MRVWLCSFALQNPYWHLQMTAMRLLAADVVAWHLEAGLSTP